MTPAVEEHLRELAIVQSASHPDRLIPPFDVHNLDILDVGCGLGQTMCAPELLGAHSYHGIDIDAEVVQLGRAMFPEFDIRLGRAESLPFPSSSFDLVYSRVALPYTNIPIALSEARRVLRPGGYIWLSLHGWQMELRSLREIRTIKSVLFRGYVWLNSLLFAATGRVFPHPLNKRYTSLQMRGGITRALKRAGFSDIRTVTEGFHFSATARRTS